MGITWRPKLSDNLHDLSPESLRWLKQMGCDHAVFQPSARLQSDDLIGKGKPYWSTDDVLPLRKSCDEAGLTLESMMLPIGFYPKSLRGELGRDDEIENVCRTITAVGEAGIPMMEWRFWPDFYFDERVGCYLTPGRGGAEARAFDYQRVIDAQPFDGIGEVGEAEMWERFLYFARPVVAAAERAGVRLSMHPNDPPVPVMRGVARIFCRPEGLARSLELIPSPANGITFCQGTFAEMGVDVLAQIRAFADRIQLVHLRTVTGQVPQYIETFIDEGDLDMLAALRIYRDCGYSGLFVSDHTPGVESDSRWGHIGRGFSLGYMRGLVTAINATEMER